MVLVTSRVVCLVGDLLCVGDKVKGFIKLLPIGSILVSFYIIGATLFALALESFVNSH